MMQQATDVVLVLLMIGLSMAADPALSERTACWTQSCPDLTHQLTEAWTLPRCQEALQFIDACVLLPVVAALASPSPRAFFLQRLKYVLGIRLLILAATSLPAPSGCAGTFGLLDGTCAQMGCSGHIAVTLLASLALEKSGLPFVIAVTYSALVSAFVVLSECHYSLCACTAWLLVFAVTGSFAPVCA